MQVKISPFLKEQKKMFENVIDELSKEFKYVSILGADSKGMSYGVRSTGASVEDSMWSERGFVLRVFNGVNYSEYSFNEIDEKDILKQIRKIAKDDIKSFKDKGISINEYPLIEEEGIIDSFFGEVEILPKDRTAEQKVLKLTEIMNKGLEKFDKLIDFRVRYEEVQVSKIFISTKKNLEQSYIYSTGALIPIAANEEGVKYSFKSYSGLKGFELLKEMETGIDEAVKEVEELLTAQKVEPGTYDIICDPDMSGLIAHEAFGHGVELDMFVKNRAKAAEFVNKPVASEITQMHDGARSAEEVSSYLFDDEGTIGTDTVIIDKGILKSGISDVLSAMKLGLKPTGNGKRESFERKAYSRMTNTFFKPGNDKLEDMIKSIAKGYILEGFQSGMEDPKNWGIQCVAMKGREIIDGKITGKIVSPVYLTGYVPDLLKSISMVSDDLVLSGGGACGKGHKEWVKTSTGGPYIKAVGRLG
jgi:TldD protein